MRRFRALHLTLLGMLLSAAASSAMPASAQTTPSNPQGGMVKTAPIVTEVIVPGTEDVVAASEIEGRIGGWFVGKVSDLAQYLELIYNFVIGFAGLLAASIMMVGGFQYLTAGGDQGKVTAAKGRIANALIGLVLALSAYLLLNTINPALVNLKTPTVGSVATELTLIPWCEDLLAKGVQVTIVPTKVGGRTLKGTECGTIGEFVTGKGKTDYCIFGADKPENRYRVGIDTSRRAPAGNQDDTQVDFNAPAKSDDLESKPSIRVCQGNQDKRCANDEECGDAGPCIRTTLKLKAQGSWNVTRSDDLPAPYISTCIQGDFLPLEFETFVKEYTKKGLPLPDGRVYAQEASCINFNTKTAEGWSLMHALGYARKTELRDDGKYYYVGVNMDSVCSRFQMFANDTRIGLSVKGTSADDRGRPDFLSRFWNYCAWTDPGVFERLGDWVGLYSAGKQSCISVFVDCETVDTNSEDGDDGPGQGCEGYDEAPEPRWASSDGGWEQYRVWQNLEKYSTHFNAICQWNPCQYYKDNLEVKKHFLGGCDRSIFSSIPGLRAVTPTDCRNNVGGEDNTSRYCQLYPDVPECQ